MHFRILGRGLDQLRSKSTAIIMFTGIVGLGVLLYAIGNQYQDKRSPEQQARELLERHLFDAKELGRIEAARCERVSATRMEREEGIEYFVNCTVPRAAHGTFVFLSVAFGGRDQVEFWDVFEG